MYVKIWRWEIYAEKVPLQEHLFLVDTFDGGIIVCVMWFMFVINRIKQRL
jgi:hypothetical protein